MSRDTAVLNVPGIDEAMNRVLREEQQARVALETCRERARMLLEHAQNRAKLIEYRTDLFTGTTMFRSRRAKREHSASDRPLTRPAG